ncbi:MAG: DUF2520 domain-containing protein [bacterium]
MNLKNTNLRKMGKQVTIAVIGKGKVGTSFAERIAKTDGYSLFSHLSARKKSFTELQKSGGPQILFICSKDSEISAVARKAVSSAGKNLKLVVHCAGSRPSTILPLRKGVARLMLHPMQTFPIAKSGLLKNIYFAISSADKSALLWAKQFVKEIGGKGIIEIKAKDLPLYHTLVVFASNFTTLLGGAVEVFSKSLKTPRVQMKAALKPLMKNSLENVLNADAAKVLTGPLARRDHSTILKHRIALKDQPAPLSKIYEGFVLLADEIL